MEQYQRQNRLAEALRIRGMKQVELCEKTGLSKASINSWLRQRWQPKQDSLLIMAKALDVSEMWLAGYDTPMERPAAQKKADVTVDLFSRIRKDSEFKELVVNLSKEESATTGLFSRLLNDPEFKELIFNLCELNESNYDTIKHLVGQLRG